MYYAMLIGGDEKTRELFKKSVLESGAIGTWDIDKGEVPPKEILEDINKTLEEESKKRNN